LLDYEWYYEVEEVEQVAHWVLSLENFVADDEVECRAFELTKRLSSEEPEAERRRDELEARLDITIVHEYEQWIAETGTRRVKREVIELDDR
jgi:hypothetical protein